jgi:3-dehydroquinate dehydratase
MGKNFDFFNGNPSAIAESIKQLLNATAEKSGIQKEDVDYLASAIDKMLDFENLDLEFEFEESKQKELIKKTKQLRRHLLMSEINMVLHLVGEIIIIILSFAVRLH